MPPPSGSRAALAIMRVEIERSPAGQLLIRVSTVSDVRGGEEPEERSFATAQPAIEHLRLWLEREIQQR
jgi:hypothetical protein